VQIATWNCEGIDTDAMDVEAEGGDLQRTQVMGKTADLQGFLDDEEHEGRPVLALALTETHLRGCATMKPITGYVILHRNRTTAQKAGRYHGGVAWLVREELAHRFTVVLKKALYGKSEGVLWLRYDDGSGGIGHLAALYRDSDYMQHMNGMAEEGYLHGLERDIDQLEEEGWVVLTGDINVWLGQYQEGQGERRGYPGRKTNFMGKELGEMMRRKDLASVQGRRGVAEATWERTSAEPSELDYIIVSSELLPQLRGHRVLAAKIGAQ
jgi:hypothetical protein